MIRTEGIVIKENKYGETSKILTILTKDLGKISVMARGVKSPKSKYVANSQVFSLNQYQLRKGRNFYFIYEAELMDSNYGLREEIYRFFYASYILELIYKSLPMEQKHENVYEMTKKALEILGTMERDFLRFILAYELKFISFIGYKPYLEACVSCGSRDFKAMKFSKELSGIVCNQCFSQDHRAVYIDQELYRTLNLLLYTELDRLDQLELKKEVILRAHNIILSYILKSIDRPEFKSLKFIEGLENI